MNMYREIEASQTLLINTQSKYLESTGEQIFKFGFGQSPFMPPARVVESLRKVAHDKSYTAVQGDLELRNLMAAFHKEHNGLEVLPDNIFVAPGSKILLFNILMAFENADVLIPSPAWVSYAPQAKLAGHHLVKVKTTFEKRWRIHPEDIEEALRQKHHKASILILNYPGNPDGLTYSREELKELALCADRNDILVLSDEIYGLLNHNQSHYSFASFYPRKTITTTGLSKWCGAGGWRLGAAFLSESIDRKFKEAFLGIGSETYSCAPAPVQQAAKSAYESYSAVENYLSWQNGILKSIGMYCAEQLAEVGLLVHPPEGGFYLFPDFSPHEETLRKKGIETCNDLCSLILLETGVALLPANAFGFDESCMAARLAYVDFAPPDELISFYLERDCPRVIEGITRIKAWIRRLKSLVSPDSDEKEY